MTLKEILEIIVTTLMMIDLIWANVLGFEVSWRAYVAGADRKPYCDWTKLALSLTCTASIYLVFAYIIIKYFM